MRFFYILTRATSNWVMTYSLFFDYSERFANRWSKEELKRAESKRFLDRFSNCEHCKMSSLIPFLLVIATICPQHLFRGGGKSFQRSLWMGVVGNWFHVGHSQLFSDPPKHFWHKIRPSVWITWRIPIFVKKTLLRLPPPYFLYMLNGHGFWVAGWRT